MNEKIITRIASVDDDNDGDSLVFCLTVDEAMVNKIQFVVNSIKKFEQSSIKIAPVNIDITVNALVYEGHDADENLRDELWEAYEGMVVEEFPEMNEEPITDRITLSINNPFEQKKIQPDYCPVWLSYNNGRAFAAPIRFLGNLVEQLFADNQAARAAIAVKRVLDRKLVFVIQSDADEEYCAHADPLVTVHMEFTEEIRNKIVTALHNLKSMRDQGIENAVVSFPVPCTGYYQNQDTVDNADDLLKKHECGLLVDEFPEMDEGFWDSDTAQLVIGLPYPGSDNSLSVSVEYAGHPARYSAISKLLSAYAQIFADGLTEI